MKTLKLWAVTVNTDQCEGRGPTKTIGYTYTKSDALEVVNNPLFYRRYSLQGRAPKWEYEINPQTIEIFDSAEELIKAKVIDEKVENVLNELNKLLEGLSEDQVDKFYKSLPPVI
jgi:hypothetical protein